VSKGGRQRGGGREREMERERDRREGGREERGFKGT